MTRRFLFFFLFPVYAFAGNTKLNIVVNDFLSGPVKVMVERGSVVERGDVYYLKSLKKGDNIIELNAKVSDKITVASGDLYREFILNDTLMVISLSSDGWNILNKDVLNSEIDNLNEFVNTSLYKFTLSGGRGGAAIKLQAKADSLKHVSETETNTLLEAYKWYASADLALLAKRKSELSLRAFYFRDHAVMPANPAWKYSFSNYFKGESLRQLKNPVFSNTISEASWQGLRQYFMNDSSIAEFNLCNWVALYCANELIQNADFGIKKIIPLLEDAKNESSDDQFIEEVNFMIRFYEPRNRGNSFPDISFKSALNKNDKKLSDFSEKPVYVMVLPDASTQTGMILRQAAQIREKFADSIEFVALLLER
ncbi:MAG: hypothetical protein R2850_06055 [Bacteroidia bacterium]